MPAPSLMLGDATPLSRGVALSTNVSCEGSLHAVEAGGVAGASNCTCQRYVPARSGVWGPDVIGPPDTG